MTTEEFEFLKEYGKRKSEVNDIKIDVTQLPYTFVKLEFLSMIQKSQIKESVLKVLELLKIKSKTLNIKEINAIFVYLYDELLTENGVINKLENTFLKSNPDVNMISAGVNELAPFNTHLTLIDICKSLNMSFDKVCKKPYIYVLDVQVALFKQSKVKERYQEILSKKK